MAEPARVSDSSSESSDGNLSNVSSPASPTASPDASPAGAVDRPRKGPFSFLSGSLTSFGFGWLALQLSSRVVAYYGDHPPH